MLGLVQVGTGVTNEMLRVWSEDSYYHIPLNVILVENSIGGTNAAMCHGAGLTNPTLTDLVEKIEFVNEEGIHTSLSVADGDKFLAARGSFGLFGIVTSLHFRFLKGKHVARFSPYAVLLEDGIPEPGDDRTDIVERYESDAQKYYSEWFWFPGSDETWVNCWDKEIAPESEVIPPYPNPANTLYEELTGSASNVIRFLKDQPELQTALFSNIAMVSLPKSPMTMLLCNALHFRRGIHNLRVHDVEALIEIPEENGKADLTFVRELWWTAVNQIREAKDSGSYPVRVALEMRLMGGSQTLLAGQYGNKYTCAIEILSFIENVDEFLSFTEQLVDSWYQLATERNVQFRIHWAKQWTKVNQQDYIDYLKQYFSDELGSFKSQVPEGAWELFSNPTLNRLFDVQ